MERSIEVIVALLGILKAGGAYVPFDSKATPERLGFMLSDANINILLTQERMLQRLPPHDARVICLDVPSGRIDTLPETRPLDSVTAESLAYVMYTSGSTGTPKGVALCHYGTAAFLEWAHNIFGSGGLNGVVASTSICFDLSVFELFAPLCSGGTVILAECHLPPALPRQDTAIR